MLGLATGTPCQVSLAPRSRVDQNVSFAPIGAVPAELPMSAVHGASTPAMTCRCWPVFRGPPLTNAGDRDALRATRRPWPRAPCVLAGIAGWRRLPTERSSASRHRRPPARELDDLFVDPDAMRTGWRGD